MITNAIVRSITDSISDGQRSQAREFFMDCSGPERERVYHELYTALPRDEFFKFSMGVINALEAIINTLDDKLEVKR